jgi:ubiquinone/menaquinone biosynthesis C-methylase UbiE
VDEERTVEKNYKMWQEVPWEGANLMGESWSPSPQWKEALVNEFAKIVEPGKVMLEIGPGAGRFTEFLQGLASHLMLVDLSDKCITLCRERFKNCDNITYFVNDGTDLSFIESSSIDYIFSFDCFNHVSPHDIEKYISQFPRILKPGGTCIIDHGTKGNVGGWRSSLTNTMLLRFLKMHKLVLERQFDSWGNGFRVAMMGDTISILKVGVE